MISKIKDFITTVSLLVIGILLFLFASQKRRAEKAEEDRRELEGKLETKKYVLQKEKDATSIHDSVDDLSSDDVKRLLIEMGADRSRTGRD